MIPKKYVLVVFPLDLARVHYRSLTIREEDSEYTNTLFRRWNTYWILKDREGGKMVQIKRMFRLCYHEQEEIRNWICFKRKDVVH